MKSYFTALLKVSVVIFCAGLSACKLANAENAKRNFSDIHFRGIKEPRIVISPGWRINDHSKQALIFGNSHCPDANGNNTYKDRCIIIDKNTMDVAVIVVDASTRSRRQETRTIERKGERTIALRPDGSYVVPWGK